MSKIIIREENLPSSGVPGAIALWVGSFLTLGVMSIVLMGIGGVFGR